MIARLGKCSQWGWMFPTKVDYDSPSPVLAPGPWTMRRYFSVSVNCIFQIFPKYFLNFSTQFCVFGIFLRAGKYFPPSWLWLPLSAAGLWSIRGGGAASWDDHRSPLSNLGLSHNTFHDTVQCHVMSHYVTQCHTILFMTLDKIQHMIIDQVQSLETIISRCVQSLCCHTMWLCTERKSIKGIFDELWRIEIKWPLSKIILQHTLETPKEPHNIKN